MLAGLVFRMLVLPSLFRACLRTLTTVFLLLLLPQVAVSQDPYDFEGHHYQIYHDNGLPLNYADALAKASMTTYKGVQAHLVSILSATEQAFLEGNSGTPLSQMFRHS